MSLLKIAILSLVSIIILFILTKIMGNREMSQLNMFDYIVSITIGSIAAELSTSLENNFWEPIVAMIVYGLVATIISYFTCKSTKFRYFISGKSKILFDNGIFYYKNFLKAKLDINEFLTQCRINGFFNISDIQTALLEPNGRISFLPSSLKRPANPQDLGLNPKTENIVSDIIVDGVLLTENLKKSGQNVNWLNKQLKQQGNIKISDIFLATCDTEANLSIYLKNNNKNLHDPF